MVKRHIVAASGGYKAGMSFPDGQGEIGSIMQYALALSGKQYPRICYIGTATGDRLRGIAEFYDACSREQVQPSHLQLFPKPNVTDIRRQLLEQDLIWVDGGGSVANMLAVWRIHRLDFILREAWMRGVVLGGMNAGSVCWHTSGTTDALGSQLQPVMNGLSLLPYSNSIRYSNQAGRRTLFQKLIGNSAFGEGYAADDGVALHYVNERLHSVVADTPGRYAYHVMNTPDGVREQRLDALLLTRDTATIRSDVRDSMGSDAVVITQA